MRRQRGFSLLEIMVVLGVFLIITGMVFELLLQAQQRYRTESEFLEAFQSARLGLDQIVRDVHTTGFPPLNSVPLTFLAANPNNANLVAEPFAWAVNYPAVPCTVLASCNNPGGPAANDVIFETDVDPEVADGVEWVRYQLRGTTLFRGITPKNIAANPAIATLNNLAPYVENVMNATTPAEMAQIQASYPNLFPGNAAVPVFQYACGVPAGPCNAIHTARDITEITITLIVRAANPDPRTQQLRVVTLTGLARRINPS